MWCCQFVGICMSCLNLSTFRRRLSGIGRNLPSLVTSLFPSPSLSAAAATAFSIGSGAASPLAKTAQTATHERPSVYADFLTARGFATEAFRAVG